MDNRSYFKKQSIAKKRQGLLRKVKTLVSSVWHKESSPVAVSTDDMQQDPKTSEQPSSSDPATPQLGAKVKDTVPATPSNGGASHTDDFDKTPNVLLSEFFQQKGNKPLTPIEYEGVMSLLTQSQKKANNGIRSPLMPGSFTRYESPIKSPKKVNKELVQSTPSQQKLLRNVAVGDVSGTEDTTMFATPEYKPNYPAVSANSSIRKSVPSVKRVYQFSGLPSPYRTKIKAPVFQSNKRVQHLPISSSSDISANTSTSRPTNKAASTLLSLLDDSKKSNDYLQQFSNPYMGKSSVSKRSHGLTADVINSTIMFDQSMDIPETVSGASSITTPAGDTASAANTETNNNASNLNSNAASNNFFVGSAEPAQHPYLTSMKETAAKPASTVASVFGGSSKEGSAAVNDNSTPSESSGGPEPASNAAGIDPPTNKASPSKDESAPVFSFSSIANNKDASTTPQFNFGKSVSATPATKPETEKAKPAFSFGNTAPSFSNSNPVPSAAPKTDTDNATTSGFTFGEAPQNSENSKPAGFEFPTVTPVHADLDTSKVEQYKSLFTFTV